MSELHVETHQHEITNIGFTEDQRVVITFDNGPLDGEVILASETMHKLYRQWQDFCAKADSASSQPTPATVKESLTVEAEPSAVVNDWLTTESAPSVLDRWRNSVLEEAAAECEKRESKCKRHDMKAVSRLCAKDIRDLKTEVLAPVKEAAKGNQSGIVGLDTDNDVPALSLRERLRTLSFLPQISREEIEKFIDAHTTNLDVPGAPQVFIVHPSKLREFLSGKRPHASAPDLQRKAKCKCPPDRVHGSPAICGKKFSQDLNAMTPDYCNNIVDHDWLCAHSRACHAPADQQAGEQEKQA